MLFENEKKDQIILEILIAVALTGSLILSTLISNASILPLMLYLFICMVKNIKNKTVKLTKKDINPWLLFWYGVCFISCVWGYFSYSSYDNEFPDYTYNLKNYCIKLLVFFIPLWLMFTLYKNRDVLESSLYRAISIMARIMMIWGLAQLVLWELFDFDLNQAVFGTLFDPDYPWTAKIPFEDGFRLRITGLNPDAAFLGLTMLLGVIFDKNRVFKILYAVTIVLCMSRTAIIGLGALVVFQIIELIINRDKLSAKEKKIIIIAVVVAVLVVVAAYVFIPWVRSKVNDVIARFDFLTNFENASMSSKQHILYIPYAFKALKIADPVQKLIGMGARMSGVFLTMNPTEFSQLPVLFTDSGWTIECDLAETIIGTGILGAIAYYGYLIYLFIKGNLKIKYFAVALAVTGIMYTYAHQTITHILFITLFLIIRNEQQNKNEERLIE